jgi:diguanylate cyclase (GGDEF)-like protein
VDEGEASEQGVADDDPAMAPDNLHVRRVIDSLIHPAQRRGDQAAGSELTGDTEHARGRRAIALPATSPGLDSLGLARLEAWRREAAREQERMARYGTATTMVAIEIDGIPDVATRLGIEAADRLLRLLSMTLRERVRAADTFARIGTWRIVGLLPETAASDAMHPIHRIEEDFAQRLGGRIQIGLSIGVEEIDARRSAAATMHAAERSMHLAARRRSTDR